MVLCAYVGGCEGGGGGGGGGGARERGQREHTCLCMHARYSVSIGVICSSTF